MTFRCEFLSFYCRLKVLLRVEYAGHVSGVKHKQKVGSWQSKREANKPNKELKINNSDQNTDRIIARVFVSLWHEVIRELYIARDNRFLSCQQFTFRFYEISIWFLCNFCSTWFTRFSWMRQRSNYALWRRNKEPIIIAHYDFYYAGVFSWAGRTVRLFKLRSYASHLKSVLMQAL